MTFFVYGVFIGAAAAGRDDHLCLSAITEAMIGRTRLIVETFNRLVILRAAHCMVYFGHLEFLAGFGNFRMPSITPLAWLYAAIPLSGARLRCSRSSSSSMAGSTDLRPRYRIRHREIRQGASIDMTAGCRAISPRPG
jgi:hypothetical protein